MAHQSSPDLIPRKVLFGNPEKVLPKISPDGSYLSYLAPVDGVLNVWVRELEESQKEARPITEDRDRGIRSYFWSQDSQQILYFQDQGGDENWRLFAVDRDGSNSRDYTPFENVQVQYVEHNRHHPERVLLAMNKDNVKLHDVYELELASGELTKIAENPGAVMGWISDKDLQIRGALQATPAGGFNFLLRSDNEGEWKKLIEWSPEDQLTSQPLSFDGEGENLYLLDSRGANTGRLVKMNLESEEIEEVLLEDPKYDVTSVVFDPETYTPQLAALTKARLEWHVLDDSIADDVERVSNLDRGDFSIYNRDRDDRYWLVGFSKDNGPQTYYIYDRQETEGDFLFPHRSDLNDYTLAKMEPISYISRDGYEIHGYLTYPPGREKSDLPVVLKVHGGPWHRDTWGLELEAQWLANRGYACLQVNFRGSTGYGKQFLNAGNREWGGKMHDDLVDGVNWIVEKGVADSDRIAIYGGSYGGYAALVGATFTPDLFCCAIDVVGPSNLLTFIKTIPPYWESLLGMMYSRVGHPEKEEDFLRQRSPLFQVDKIEIPLLIVQGANDPRVKKSESEQIVEALEEKGIDHEYLLFQDEGHGFAKPENRLEFYGKAEEFLARHLGGRKES